MDWKECSTELEPHFGVYQYRHSVFHKPTQFSKRHTLFTPRFDPLNTLSENIQRKWGHQPFKSF